MKNGLEIPTNILQYLRLELSSRQFPSHTMSQYHGLSIPRLESTWDAMEGYLRCSPSGHVEKWKNANNTPCLHRIASGVLSMGSWVKVTLSSVVLGWEEGLRFVWGPLAGFSCKGTPAKWAHEMTDICPKTLPKPYIPTLAA